MVALLCLVPAAVSLVGALGGRSNASLGIRLVEWLRDNGARGLVNRVESVYYSLNAPATGGPGLRALPSQPGVVATGGRRRTAAGRLLDPAPASIVGVIHPRLPGEAMWRATFSAAPRARPPVLITSFRPDPNYPRLVAGVAWINSRRTRTVLYPGQLEPAVTLPSRGPAEVPSAASRPPGGDVQQRLQAARTPAADSRWMDTRTRRCSNGLATIRRAHATAAVDVVSWTGGPAAGPDVLFARQNLPLIVNGGATEPEPVRRPRMGRDARQCGAGVALRRRGRRSRQPDLRRGQRPDRRIAGRDPDPRRRHPGDGARHQHLLDELHHLPSGPARSAQRTCCRT